MKMRELEAKTGVNRETIRVWLREGFVPEPARPARNVADYDETHVRAILAVRELQRVNGLTLPQIKEAMNGRAPQRRVEAGAFQHLEELVASRVGYQEEHRVAVSSLADRNPHAATDAEVFEELGLVTLIENGEGPQLSLSDAKLIEIWGRMRLAGFMEGVGFPPHILEYYRHASEYVAANEAKYFFERTEGRIDEFEAAGMLQMALPLMLDFFGLLRQKAFMRNLHRATQEGQPVEIPKFPPRRVSERPKRTSAKPEASRSKQARA